MIKLENVSKSYKQGKSEFFALKNISLNIKEGDFVAIHGPSGSGKSTLMHLIGGLDRTTTGTIVVAGKALSKLSDKNLARYRNENVGFVFQFFNLLPNLSVYDNINLPLVYSKNKIEKPKNRILQLLDVLKIPEKVKSKPTELSGGQQQRVAIARALVNNPQIILADEPTGNLDSKTGEEILRLLYNLNKEGKTVILVTHDNNLIRYASKAIYIKDGQIP